MIGRPNFHRSPSLSFHHHYLVDVHDLLGAGGEREKGDGCSGGGADGVMGSMSTPAAAQSRCFVCVQANKPAARTQPHACMHRIACFIYFYLLARRLRIQARSAGRHTRGARLIKRGRQGGPKVKPLRSSGLGWIGRRAGAVFGVFGGEGVGIRSRGGGGTHP